MRNSTIASANDSRSNESTAFTRKLICIELMEVKNQKGISIKPLDSRYVEIWYSHVFCLVCHMRRLHFHSARIRISCKLSSVCWIYRLTFHGGRMLSSTVIVPPDSVDAGFCLNYVVRIQTGHKMHAREYDSNQTLGKRIASEIKYQRDRTQYAQLLLLFALGAWMQFMIYIQPLAFSREHAFNYV